MSFSQFRFSQLDPLPKIDNVQLGNTIGQGSFAMYVLISHSSSILILTYRPLVQCQIGIFEKPDICN